MLLILIALAGVILAIESIALDQINRALKRHLTEGGRLEAIDIRLATGRIAFSGVTVQSPKGDSGKPLLVLDNMVLDVDLATVFDDLIVIDELILKGMTIDLMRDAQGKTGLDNLLRSDDSSTAQNKAGTPKAAKPVAEKTIRPSILIKKIRVADGVVNYQDIALTGKPMRFPLKDIAVSVGRLRLFDGDTAAETANIVISGQLQQPGQLPDAHFGILAQMAPISQNMPMMNVQTRLIGLKLNTLGVLLPPATRTTLGGDGLDSAMAMALNAGRIHLDAQVLTDRNVHYDTIHIRGPLDKPVVKIAPVAAGVFRVSGGVLNVGRRGLGTGIHIAESGVDVAKEIGEGALKAGKNLLTGLLDAGKGLLAMDDKQVKAGLVDSTAGTIGDTMKTVETAGRDAGLGLNGSVSRLTGKNNVQNWDQGIGQRFRKAMQQAREALDAMPYPPAVD
ncbi:hypothetical protein DSCW_59630 [Desulfosarcina widdelii]|uniref:Uncharacterized protein n=1 Tax=Desulfosarcina widdelii TaxID=947919 RepID=A0A5K7Z9M8_9BACT|nr:hypothetical protein DSCW_59630 [Desulfosarcina widdelii]